MNEDLSSDFSLKTPRRIPKAVATNTFSEYPFAENHFEQAGKPSSPLKSAKRTHAYSDGNSFAVEEEQKTDGLVEQRFEFKANQTVAAFNEVENTWCNSHEDISSAVSESIADWQKKTVSSRTIN